MHKLGIIGYGGMASNYHHETANRKDVPIEAVAAYDINPERVELAKSRGLKGFNNLSEFLAEDFDFCLVATSNNFHCEMACAALNAGKNVMVEKPCAMSSGEIQTMIDCAKKNNRLFTVHHNRRWDRDFMIVKKAFDDGVLKEPYMIESRIHGNGGSMRGWRSQPDHGGGMLLDWGIHAMDQMLYLIQEPVKTVSATIKNITTEEVDDYAKVILGFERGLTAMVEVATFAILPLPRWSVYCKDGALELQSISVENGKLRKVVDPHYEPSDILVYSHDGVAHRTEQDFKCTFEDSTYPTEALPQDLAALYKNVIAALDGKEELIVKPEQVLRCFKVIEAAFKSSREHITIKM